MADNMISFSGQYDPTKRADLQSPQNTELFKAPITPQSMMQNSSYQLGMGSPQKKELSLDSIGKPPKVDNSDMIKDVTAGSVSAANIISRQLQELQAANMAQYNQRFQQYANTPKYDPYVGMMDASTPAITSDLYTPPKEGDYTRGLPSAEKASKGVVLESGLGTAAQGAGVGAQIGTAFAPGVGTAVGAGIGALIGGIGGLFMGEEKMKKAREMDKDARDAAIQQYTADLENYRMKKKAAEELTRSNRRRQEVAESKQARSDMQQAETTRRLQSKASMMNTFAEALQKDKQSRLLSGVNAPNRMVGLR